MYVSMCVVFVFVIILMNNICTYQPANFMILVLTGIRYTERWAPTEKPPAVSRKFQWPRKNLTFGTKKKYQITNQKSRNLVQDKMMQIDEMTHILHWRWDWVFKEAKHLLIRIWHPSCQIQWSGNCESQLEGSTRHAKQDTYQSRSNRRLLIDLKCAGIASLLISKDRRLLIGGK